MRRRSVSLRRDLPAPIVFLAIGGAGEPFFIPALTLGAVYRIRDAKLSAFQLVVLRTALNGAILVFERPKGVVVDVYSRHSPLSSATPRLAWDSPSRG